MDFIPYGRQWIDDEDIKTVVEVLKGDFITQGKTVEKFERSLAEYCGAKRSTVNLSTGSWDLMAFPYRVRRSFTAPKSAFLSTPP